MAEFSTREVTTTCREYVLISPTNWAEVSKVLTAVQDELPSDASDNHVTVTGTDEEIVFSFETNREVSRG